MGHPKVRVSTVHRAQGSECHTVIFDPVIASGDRLLGHPEEGPRLINVALSRAKARLVVIISAGDLANEYLRRISQVVNGEGQFDDAVPLEQIIGRTNFPLCSIGVVVRWGETVGPIESHAGRESFCVNDFVTGKRKIFKTEAVRACCAASTAAHE